MKRIEIDKIIKDGLKKNHMTQATLAATLEIERATVNRWCVGRAIPEADTFLRVCQILHVRLDAYLYEGDDPLQTQMMRMVARLSEKQKVAMLRMLNQIMDMIEESVAG